MVLEQFVIWVKSSFWRFTAAHRNMLPSIYTDKSPPWAIDFSIETNVRFCEDSNEIAEPPVNNAKRLHVSAVVKLGWGAGEYRV